MVVAEVFKQVYRSVMMLLDEYKHLLLGVAFNEDLDFLTKFMTVAINLLIFAEFAYFLLPRSLKKILQDADRPPGA